MCIVNCIPTCSGMCPQTPPLSMMTSSNGNIFRVTGHLCGEFTGDRWIPSTKASDAELWCFLWSAWINVWVYNCETGDLRRNRAHYDVIVMLPRKYYLPSGRCRPFHSGWSAVIVVIVMLPRKYYLPSGRCRPFHSGWSVVIVGVKFLVTMQISIPAKVSLLVSVVDISFNAF